MIFLLLVALLTQPGGPSPEPTAAQFGVLVYATGLADIRNGLSTLRADTLTAYPEALYRDDMFSLEAVAAVEYAGDSLRLYPVSAGGFFTWPGSPWISSGVFRGLREPFIPGLSDPICEWRSTGVTDITGVSAEAGGILGFQGFWRQYGDSLSWYGIRSPWLGMGMVSWNNLDTDSSSFESFSGFVDLRKAQPWFVVAGSEDEWSAELEVRGVKPVSAPSMTLEVVPGAYWSEDSSSVALKGFITSAVRSFSAHLGAEADTDSLTSPDLTAGLDLLSRAGILWSLELGLTGMEDFSGSISGQYRASPVGCGGAVDLVEDSLSVTATALYSPLRGVCSQLSITSDLSTDSPDPSCTFGVHGSGSRGIAGITVHWEDGVTELGLGVSAWID